MYWLPIQCMNFLLAQKNVEMDCRFEDERLKFEAERKNLETIKAQLQTKLNQTISQSELALAQAS